MFPHDLTLYGVVCSHFVVRFHHCKLITMSDSSICEKMNNNNLGSTGESDTDIENVSDGLLNGDSDTENISKIADFVIEEVNNMNDDRPFRERTKKLCNLLIAVVPPKKRKWAAEVVERRLNDQGKLFVKMSLICIKLHVL